MQVTTTFADTRLAMRSGRSGLVPTLGYLHEGHESLLERSVAENDVTAMSIFVNPLQFENPADLDRYPRDLDRDLEIAESAGVDVVFVPDMAEMYPRPPLTTVAVANVGDHLEGAHRPGHFTGVATVVAKLFAGIRSDVAYFGRKDAQQLAVVTTMAKDLRFGIDIVPCSTVRERDGLALSSRNVFLSEVERDRALGISAGLFAAADEIEAGQPNADTLHAICRSRLAGLHVEYVQLADQAQAQALRSLDRPAFLAVAATVGSTRLIDNVAIDPSREGWTVDRGQRLDGPSMLYGGRSAVGG